MSKKVSRRHFLNSTALTAGAAAAVAGVVLSSRPASALQSAPAGKIKIIVLNGSQRRDKTTVAGLTVAMGAAKAVAPDKIEVELVHLLDYNLFASTLILGDLAVPNVAGKTEFVKLEEKLSAPGVRGIIVGSPVNNSSLSPLVSMCFAQIRHGNDKNGLPFLEGKAAGALAVGAARNGGQENVVNGINTYFFHEKMVLVGADTGRVGALLWNQKDSIDADEYGKRLAATLGQRVAKAALALPEKMF